MLSRITGLTVLGWLIQPGLAIAATSGMPWETPLEQVSSSMTGPVVTSIAAIAVAVTGVLFALAPEGGFARRAASIGLSLFDCSGRPLVCRNAVWQR